MALVGRLRSGRWRSGRDEQRAGEKAFVHSFDDRHPVSLLLVESFVTDCRAQRRLEVAREP